MSMESKFKIRLLQSNGPKASFRRNRSKTGPTCSVLYSTTTTMAMATRMAFRSVSRRFSSGSGKVLSEEEKAAENVYIKKIEQEKLEKLARKGPKPEEKPDAGSGGSVAEAKPSSSTSTTGASTEKGPKPEEKPDAGSGGSVAEAKPSSSTSTTGASTEKVSTDRYRNYGVLAGVVTFAGALGWYLMSKEKKQEVQE
ncbi:hypothetical protein V6N13_145184 [Hibiscus sabdariffa]|uniref:Copper ion binding protein n=2 Tax=Hibiscus sabdariffa TaxID=183260 RepID=A0ABR2FN36_9ROSI